MTAFTSSAIINHNNTANFQAWINEIYTGLVTNCGLTQTGDTGQDSVPSTAVYTASLNTAVSYYVFRFNDTLQATSPIFFKVEFGTGGAATYPAIWITVGTSSNGAGTIGGISMVRCAAMCNQAAISQVTSYPSRFCYNATQGACTFSWKTTGVGTAASMGGFMIGRSVNNNGAPTGDSCHLWTNSSVANSTGVGPNLQIINYNTAALVPGLTNFPYDHFYVPFRVTATAQGNTAQVFPAFQYKGNATTPGWGITNVWNICLQSEFAIGTSFNSTILGSTSLTYVSVGSGTGNTSSLGGQNLALTTYSIGMLYQ